MAYCIFDYGRKLAGEGLVFCPPVETDYGALYRHAEARVERRLTSFNPDRSPIQGGSPSTRSRCRRGQR